MKLYELENNKRFTLVDDNSKTVFTCKRIDSEIDGHKLTMVTREGAVSYAKAFKDLMPDVDLSAYKGNSTSYWSLS